MVFIILCFTKVFFRPMGFQMGLNIMIKKVFVISVFDNGDKSRQNSNVCQNSLSIYNVNKSNKWV